MDDGVRKRDELLRLIRYFLPRLGREELAYEIEEEKQRLRDESDSAIKDIEQECELETADEHAEQQRQAEASEARLRDLRDKGQQKIRAETGARKAQISQEQSRKSRNVAILLIACLVFVVGVAALATSTLVAPTAHVVWVIGGIGVLFAAIDLARAASSIATINAEIKRIEAEIEEEVQQQVIAEESERQKSQNESNERIASLRKDRDANIEAEKESLRQELDSLEARVDELVQLYEDSVAAEDEVILCCNQQLKTLQEHVPNALDFSSTDQLDERCAEIWTPTILQTQHLPESVVRESIQSGKQMLSWADDIIAPMRSALPEDDQWRAFRRRVLPLLGLAEALNESNKLTTEDSLQKIPNAIRAVRFSDARRTYLAGHYFYQKIVCVEDMIGIFRGYWNMLSQQVPNTFALQILYVDVTSIAIETESSREHFDLSKMTIDQHTHTLTLGLTSGVHYRMSGDAGSSARIEASRDHDAATVASEANEVFRNQIKNVRSLIRDAKAAQLRSQGIHSAEAMT